MMARKVVATLLAIMRARPNMAAFIVSGIQCEAKLQEIRKAWPS